MFNAVFFDMDGVTIDSEPQWHDSERELMAEFGYAWQEEDQVACLGGPLSRVGLYMAAKVHSSHDGAWFTQALIEKQMEKMSSGADVLPGVFELITEIRAAQLPVALVSASPRNIMNAVLKGLPEGLFDFSISSDDVKNTKPDPDPYLLAAQKAGVDISHSLVIEDSLTGIHSAKSAGSWVLAVPHFIKVKQEERLRTVPSLAGLTFSRIQELFQSQI